VAEDARWALEFERRAERDMARLDPQIARRVIAALDRLLDQDPSLDLRRLKSKRRMASSGR
jgi:mRNA-degrading endonuclease RelE of RelBE toxin-antitoxin system